MCCVSPIRKEALIGVANAYTFLSDAGLLRLFLQADAPSAQTARSLPPPSSQVQRPRDGRAGPKIKRAPTSEKAPLADGAGGSLILGFSLKAGLAVRRPSCCNFGFAHDSCITFRGRLELDVQKCHE